MKKETKRLPDGELEVMQVLWDCPVPAPRAELEARILAQRPMAQTTLLTLLARLREKGFVRVEKQGRSSVYTPLVSRRDYLAAQSRRFLHKLCGGSLNTFANALCDGGLTEAELAELRALLERQKP